MKQLHHFLLGLLAALVIPVGASDNGAHMPRPEDDQQFIDDLGAVQRSGRCAPQFIIRVPDFPKADHVSDANVTVDFSTARICSPGGEPEPTREERLEQARDRIYRYPGLPQ